MEKVNAVRVTVIQTMAKHQLKQIVISIMKFVIQVESLKQSLKQISRGYPKTKGHNK